MDKTNNLGLNLPQYNETADIEVLNANFEILDAAIKMKEEVHLLSGFASGWEGGIKLIKNSDGLVHANLFVDNNAGIPLDVTTIFTLPQGFRPKALGNASTLLLTNAYSSTGSSIPNFFVNVGVLGNGVIYVYPVTGTVFNASAVNLRNLVFVYYTN